MRVLVVEDSARLADTIAESLKKENMIVDVVSNGSLGYEYAQTGIYDIAVLDLMLPEMSGYEVLEKLRQDKNDIPVLILSAKSDIEDKINGLKLGADDYLTKPFDMRELILRIFTVTKRHNNIKSDTLEYGTLHLDLSTCSISNSESDKSMIIAGKELKLLELFLRNPAQVLEKEQITTRVWGYDSDAEYNNVEVYVSFVRKKLAFLKVNVKIRSIRGIGYIMEINDD